ncbi:type II secretion system F family protein [Candidatus Woesearchaeota archaeon]|nr:type II secretion system F family protein [Candidatus Woesearchaeota archaeon]
MAKENLKFFAEKLSSLVEEIVMARNYKNVFLKNMIEIKDDLASGRISKLDYELTLGKVLKNRKEGEWIDYYNQNIKELFDQITIISDAIIADFSQQKITRKTKIVIEAEEGKISRLTKKEKTLYSQQVNLEPERIKNYLKNKKTKRLAEFEMDYVLYESTSYGKVANIFVEPLMLKLTKKYPQIFQSLYDALRSSGMKVLSKTYVSIIIFTSIWSALALIPILIIFWRDTNLAARIIRGLFLGILGGGITGLAMFYYPASLLGGIKKGIRRDLPFVVVHMAAIAGSGAQPVSIFSTILKSEEYKGLKSEIKKIVNYVNLFGYDLSTALRLVANTTPSVQFKDLLNGIISTIQTGGDLKQYLHSSAESALATYRLERKRYADSMATYSDVYTGLLIAAPLLFFVTLAIIQSLGGEIGGLSVSTIALIGVGLVLPLLNVGFLVFLNLNKPE